MNEQKHWDEMAKHGPFNVIDSGDKKGIKNKYIRYIKDQAVKNILPDREISILDFGCGSGNLSKTFASHKYKILGIDISLQQLMLAVEDNIADHSLFIQYNGNHIPLKDDIMEFVTAMGVFNFILDDPSLLLSLQQINRILSDKGRLICTIHTKKYKKYYDSEKKVIRTEEDFLHIFLEAGFDVEKKEYIRKSHHPLIYLIRYGLIPVKIFNHLAQLDKYLASIFNKPLLGYVDTLLILKKRNT